MSRSAALLRTAAPATAPPAISPLLARGPAVQRSCAVRDGDKGEEDKGPACDVAEQRDAVQAKLTIGAPDDPLEKEADEVADKVMRMPDAGAPAITGLADEDDRLQRSAEAGAARARPKVPASLGSPSGGAPLPAEARNFFEPRLARGLGHVRIHDGAPAARMARDIHARAFTHCSDIYFATGQFDPQSQAGRLLLAHELAHVIQQTGPGPAVSAESGLLQRRESQGASGGSTGLPEPHSALGPVAATNAGSVSALDRKVLHSSGRPLDSRTRHAMERRLAREPGRIRPFAAERGVGPSLPGSEREAERSAAAALAYPPSGGARQDFSAVRVHEGAAAAASAGARGAAAYAIGNRLVFGSGNYRPDTPAGAHLLAHELAHLLQQDCNDRQSIDCFEAPMHQRVERAGLKVSGFSNEAVSAIYFGNWMRDMNQLFVPMLTDMLGADVIFSLISYMAAKKFGRELTPEQFGFYIPAEHLDNPAGLVKADDLHKSQPPVSPAARPSLPGRFAARPPELDTTQEDVAPGSQVKGAVMDKGADIFSVDQTGVMAFLRRSNLHVEHRLELAAKAGYTEDGLQHFGAALHAVEDLFAHSNFVEIAVAKLLKGNAAAPGTKGKAGEEFLPQLEGEDRKVFTYSAQASVQGKDGRGVESRPVLTTGSFTGADTNISLSSEAVNILSHPLPEPVTNLEKRAMQRLTLAMLRSFDDRLRHDKAFRNALIDGVNGLDPVFGPVAGKIVSGSIGTVSLPEIYQLIMQIPMLPEWVRIPLQKLVHDLAFEHGMKPAAGTVQAIAMETKVADTSLISVLRESQGQSAGKFTPAAEGTMEFLGRASGKTVEAQKQEATAKAGRRVAALKNTPAHVVAGPSHSQIAKDHANSPFFGLAFYLATHAVKRLGDKMLDTWEELSGTRLPRVDFSDGKFPASAPKGASVNESKVYKDAQATYAAGRTTRAKAEAESLLTGQKIFLQGGEEGQSYDLEVMRRQAADRIMKAAYALTALANAPEKAGAGIASFEAMAAELVPKVVERYGGWLDAAKKAAGKAEQSKAVAGLRAVAGSLAVAAALVRNARRHAKRAAANAYLVDQRQRALAALGAMPSLSNATATALLYMLDEEIQATAVAYAQEQRDVVEGRKALPELNASNAGLTVKTVKLPEIKGSKAMVALITEARRLFGHPYEDNWWEKPVRTYAADHPDHLANDIEARNEGVTFYRTSAQHPNESHED